MLEVMEAVRFDGDAQGGATVPAKMGCYRGDGSQVDAFVKFSSGQCPPGGLAREVVGCLLAKQLGLSVGLPALVNVHPDLIDSVQRISPSTGFRMKGSVQPAFGSLSLGTGFVRCDGIDRSNSVLRKAAIDIWAFDQLVMNPDRNATKPNCLMKGDILAVIDHEKTLNCHGVGGLVPAPWQDSWKADSRHIFGNLASAGPVDLDRLEGAWCSLNSHELDRIVSAVPESWVVVDILQQISEYLKELLNNIQAAFSNLRGVAS